MVSVMVRRSHMGSCPNFELVPYAVNGRRSIRGTWSTSLTLRVAYSSGGGSCSSAISRSGGSGANFGGKNDLSPLGVACCRFMLSQNAVSSDAVIATIVAVGAGERGASSGP